MRYCPTSASVEARLCPKADSRAAYGAECCWRRVSTALPVVGGSPSRKNEVLYHGVFAPHAAWRPLVVPRPQPDPTPVHLHRRLTRESAAHPAPYWPSWASLLWRIFQVDPLTCPACGQPLRLRCVVLPPATLDVLAGLQAAAARAPPPLALPQPTAQAAGLLPAASRPPASTFAS